MKVAPYYFVIEVMALESWFLDAEDVEI